MALTRHQRKLLEVLDLPRWRVRAAGGSVAEVGEAPVFESESEPVPVSEPAAKSAPTEPAPVSEPVPASGTADAQTALEQIHAEVVACKNCELHTTRTCAVPGEGAANARWMFIGEAPGQNEDNQGRPFVGRAGQLLTSMLGALGFKREEVFIANVIKCRPPQNRDPNSEEVAACEPYLLRQVQAIRPHMLVALGRIAAQTLLKTDQPLSKLRGRLHQYGDPPTPLLVTYHPAYLLRSPEQKAKAWEDLCMAAAAAEPPPN